MKPWTTHLTKDGLRLFDVLGIWSGVGGLTIFLAQAFNEEAFLMKITHLME